MNEYTEEFYQLNARVNLSETEDQLIVGYIGGLKLVIQDQLALQGVWTMIDAVNLAMKVESQINRSMVRTEGNFLQPTQKASSAPKGSTTSGSNKMPLQLKIRHKIEVELQPLFDLIMTLMRIQI